VFADSMVLLEADLGCAHGGVGSVAGVSAGGCGVASAGLTLPDLDLFMAGIVAVTCG
jgi:hypothetical protein